MGTAESEWQRVKKFKFEFLTFFLFMMILLKLHIHLITCNFANRRGKKTLNKVTTDLPEEDEDVSAFGGGDDDDPQPPKLMAAANYDEDFRGNQTEPDAIDVDYETNDDGRVPSPLEPQRSSSPPIEFQVDEDSSNEVICVE